METGPNLPPLRRRAIARLRGASVRRAFVFSAGGALGAFQAGQIKAVIEAGIQPDVLVGVSAGALNAAFLSNGASVARVNHMVSMWEQAPTRDLMETSLYQRGRRLAKRESYLYSSEPLMELIDEVCRSCSPELVDVSDAALELHILACDLVTGKAVWFEEGPARVAMLASAAIPGFLAPVVYGDNILIDGGVHTPMPIDRAIELGCDEIWAFPVPRLSRAGVADLSALGVLIRSFTIARWAGSEAPERNDIVVHELPTPEVEGSSPAAFKLVDRFIEAGYVSASGYLEALGDDRHPHRILGRVLRRHQTAT